jgi:eukaryotic-like serine/threonine-protein kinase
MYRYEDCDTWLHRARVVTARAERQIRQSQAPRDSLFRGELGVALLICDLDDPRNARFPLFEGDD